VGAERTFHTRGVSGVSEGEGKAGAIATQPNRAHEERAMMRLRESAED
jgi:hypothetical protein